MDRGGSGNARRTSAYGEAGAGVAGDVRGVGGEAADVLALGAVLGGGGGSPL